MNISVAMCTYNGAPYLQEQLDTIAAQTKRPFELVVCDDRSTDATVNMLQEFARTAQFPVRIHKNLTQLGSTRNFDQAIRLCQGEYIALSDQDDRWKPEKLARLGAMLDLHPDAGMVFSDATLIDHASQPTGETLWQSFRFLKSARHLFQTNPGRVLLERPVVTGATMMFRQSLLSHFRSIPAPWVHDGWITWMSVFWSRPLFVEDALTDYRIHASQQLGVGKTSLLGRIQEIRGKQQRHYASMAGDLEQLLGYVQQSSPEIAERWAEKIREAMMFFRARANARAGLERIPFLLRHLKSYQSLSGSVWRALFRDLLMGHEENR